MEFEFEWDEDKRGDLLRQRGIDILDAARMFNRPEAMEIWPDPRDHEGERRYNAIGPVEEVYYELVFAWRDDRVRLITAWKLNDKSRQKAQARYARRTQRDEKARRDR
ncbi:MAG: BrnT family toxin [Pseudomonadota bacterium]